MKRRVDDEKSCVMPCNLVSERCWRHIMKIIKNKIIHYHYHIKITTTHYNPFSGIRVKPRWTLRQMHVSLPNIYKMSWNKNTFTGVSVSHKKSMNELIYTMSVKQIMRCVFVIVIMHATTTKTTRQRKIVCHLNHLHLRQRCLLIFFVAMIIINQWNSISVEEWHKTNPNSNMRMKMMKNTKTKTKKNMKSMPCCLTR